MASLQYLMNTGTTSHVVDTQGNNLVTPQNLARLKGLPIFFFSGSENSVYLPENTDTSFTALSDANGGLFYERQVFEGRGHLDAWMSSTAHQDVFPRVLNHINNVHEGKYASFSKEISKLKSAR